MDQQLQVFEKVFNGREYRWIEIEGEPWFVGPDMAQGLGYVDPKQAIRMHCKQSRLLKGVAATPLTTSPYGITIISEGDLYALIGACQLKAAEPFKDWIYYTVLPSIRKTGQYVHKPQALSSTDPRVLLGQLEEAGRQLQASNALARWALEEGQQWKEAQYREKIRGDAFEGKSTQLQARLDALHTYELEGMWLWDFGRQVMFEPELGPRAIYRVLGQRDVKVLYEDRGIWRANVLYIKQGYFQHRENFTVEYGFQRPFRAVWITPTGQQWVEALLEPLGYKVRRGSEYGKVIKLRSV